MYTPTISSSRYAYRSILTIHLGLDVAHLSGIIFSDFDDGLPRYNEVLCDFYRLPTYRK